MRTFIRLLVSWGLLFLFTQSLPSQWYQQPFPTSEYLWRVQFADSLVGWIFGHDYIYHTTDGGSTWVTQDSGWGGGEMFFAKNRDAAFYANWYGTPVPFTGLRRTTDGGTTWSTIDTTSFFYLDMEFVNDQTGFAGGGVPPDYRPALRKTTDGGTTWTTIWFDSTQNFELEGISFIDDAMGWAISYRGVVFKTTNGGTTWVLQDTLEAGTPFWQPFRDIQFVSADSGWAVGGISGYSFIAQTTDGGANWSYFDATTLQGGSLREVGFHNNQIGWAVGSAGGHPLRTSTGGATWEAQVLSPPLTGGFESMSMASTNLGWIVGGSGTVYKTTNGGVVWVGTDDQLPATVRLKQNFPNPFNPRTTIAYEIPKTSHVILTIFNLLGEEIATIVDNEQAVGNHTAMWDASANSSGVYVAQLRAGSETKAIKIMLVK